MLSGFNHLTLAVSELTSSVVVWEDNRSEGWAYYFLDPDGHKLELHVGTLVQRLAACRERPYQGMVFYDE